MLWNQVLSMLVTSSVCVLCVTAAPVFNSANYKLSGVTLDGIPVERIPVEFLQAALMHEKAADFPETPDETSDQEESESGNDVITSTATSGRTVRHDSRKSMAGKDRKSSASNYCKSEECLKEALEYEEWKRDHGFSSSSDTGQRWG